MTWLEEQLTVCLEGILPLRKRGLITETNREERLQVVTASRESLDAGEAVGR